MALAILVVLALRVDLGEVWRRVRGCNKALLLVGALAHYGTYPIRGRRWRRCLVHLPLHAGKGRFGLLVFFYNFIDNVVPAKLGDVYGAHLARINAGVSRSAALGAIVFARTIDAWIVLLLAAGSCWMLFAAKLPPAVLWSLIGGLGLAATASFVMGVFFLLKRALPPWVPERVAGMIQAFHTGMWPRPREIAPIAVQSLLIWVLESTWFYFVARAFGLHLSLTETVFLTMIPLLATAFPLTPSGAGAVELTIFACLRAVGVAEPLAVSLTAVNRFIDFWLHIALGVGVWSLRGPLGLRTWRDAPDAPGAGTETETPLDKPQHTPPEEVVYEHS